MLQSLLFFVSGFFWGWVSDPSATLAMILQAIIGIPLGAALSVYPELHDDRAILSDSRTVASWWHFRTKSEYLSERFPTEVRATAGGSLLSRAPSLGLTAPVLTYLA